MQTHARANEHDIVETHGYMQECQWAYMPAFEWDNVATAGFDQDVSAAKAFS